jgi:hypothetical protein
MVLSKWIYMTSESRMNKPVTVVDVELPHFKDLEFVQSSMKWDQSLRIIQVLCLRLSAGNVAVVVRVRKSPDIMRPLERCSVLKTR